MRRDTETILEELYVIRCQSGDERAFEWLVKRHQARLLRVALARVQQSDAALEIVQDTWAVAVRSIRRLRDPARFRAWIDQIARNKATDWIRRKQRQRVAMHAVTQAAQSDQNRRTSSLLNADKSESLERMRNALRDLDPDARDLLHRFYLRGESIGRIAGELQIAPGTVKSRLFYARDALRQAIERKEP